MKKEHKKYYIFEMNTIILNIGSIVLLVLLGYITSLIDKDTFLNSIELFDEKFPIFMLSLLGYLVLHELLHSLAYVIYGGKYNKITYGVALEKGIFYCLCKQNISKKNILHSLMFPLFFIGIVTYVISLIFNYNILLWLSLFNLSGCIGDIIMFAYIVKLKNIEFSEMDNPIAFGIYSDYDVSKINHFGLVYKGTKDELERKDFKKINISKPSKYILILLIVLIIIMFLL